MAVMHRVTSGLLAAVLSAIVVGAASLHFREQSPPPATLAGRPAPLDRATIEQRVEPLLNAHLRVNRFSGVVLASQGKTLVAKAYGHANVEWQIPNTTTTKFRIGSITEQFTSMLVMQLRERGIRRCIATACCPPQRSTDVDAVQGRLRIRVGGTSQCRTSSAATASWRTRAESTAFRAQSFACRTRT